MKSAFFISDVHLSKMASPSGEAILLLLKRAQQEASVFVVLGDLFDIWVGSGSAFQKEYAPVIEEFRKLKETCKIIYLEGNHDFHLQKFWGAKLGFEISDKPQDLEFGGKKIRLEHGDEINRDDRGYLFLRWFLRTAPLKFAIENFPSSIVLSVGKSFSKASRAYTSQINNPSFDLFRKYAQKLRREQDYDLLVVGHNHMPDDFSFVTNKKEGRLINLGAWFGGPKYLEVTGSGQIQIHRL